MGNIYIDRLSPLSLLAVIRLRRDYHNVYYFDCSNLADPLARVFCKLRLLKAVPQPLVFNLGRITNENHECRSTQIVGDITRICRTIEAGELLSNEIIKFTSKKFDRRKMLLFFKKIIAWDIEMPVIYINAAEWHSRQKGVNRPLLVFRNDQWLPYLADYAEQLGLTFIGYGVRRRRSDYFRRHIRRLTAALKPRLLRAKQPSSAIVAKLFAKTPTVDASADIVDEGGKPKLAALFAGRTVTFDLKKRSEFFWLLKSNIPFEQVLVYLGMPHLKINRAVADLITEKKMFLVALSKNTAGSLPVLVWRASISLREYSEYAIPVLRQFLRHPRKNRFYTLCSLYFIVKYLRWRKFFEANNIKINLNPTDFMEAQIPMQQALEDSGGVSVSYHWSNMDFNSIFMGNCANVFFSFGPAYKAVFEKSQAVIDNLVYSGYITDYSFKEVKDNALKLRERLLSGGAKFILCFFDENSYEGQTSVITHQKTTDTYRYFIERMLEDESLGLIFKPGYPTSIYQRISQISDLIAKAKATGRCVFIDKGTYVSEQYPSEAAQAADLSIGLLLSGTVALESYLSRTPTVFLDLEKFYSNPIYKWGKGKVVFDTLDGLFSTIERYRQEPGSIPGFGDLSKWAEGKDPFRDGQASLRIGQYLSWLLEKFDKGKTRQEAIAYANTKYTEIWGAGSVQ